MARFNEILVGRYNRYAQKLLSMKGGAALPTLAPELTFVLPVFSGAENRWLEGWDLFGAGISQAGAAGLQTLVMMRNPPTTNVVAVVTLVSADELTTADQPQLVINWNGPSDQANVVAVFGMDPRPGSSILGSRQSSVIMSSGTAAPTGNQQTLLRADFPAATVYQFLVNGNEIPLFPGMGLFVRANQNNQTMSTSWMWRERALEESERK